MKRTPEDPVHGYEDWSTFAKQMEEVEAMCAATAKCVWCGGKGEVWERNCDDEDTLVPCPDCMGLGLSIIDELDMEPED